MGANGPLNLLVPRVKTPERQAISESEIHAESDWRTLHWRSLTAAYRNSPYFEYYEDELEPFFDKKHSHHFQLGIESIELTCELLGIELHLGITENYETAPIAMDMRNAWNKKDYVSNPLVDDFPQYIQVFSDRHLFSADLSILDLLFCLGPQAKQYLQNLKFHEFKNQ